jgi:hypothetical protein
MRRSSRSAASYHAPQTGDFTEAFVPDAPRPAAAQAHSDAACDSSSGTAVQPYAPVASEDQAIPLQRGPIGTFYLSSPPYPSSSNKGINAGEKHALAAGFFVMLSLAAAFGIGWWATLPPPPAMANGERPMPQANAWISGEKELAAPVSSGSSAFATDADETKEVREAMKALTVEMPGVNEITLSQPKVKEDSPSGAAAAPLPDDKSERASGQAERDSRSEEVSRLKAEAYSETRRNRLSRSTPAKSAPKEEGIKQKGVRRQPTSLSGSVSPSQKADLRRALAKCKEEDGLFYQERCKWRLCNGQWGKHGCPSYGRNKREDYPVS